MERDEIRALLEQCIDEIPDEWRMDAARDSAAMRRILAGPESDRVLAAIVAAQSLRHITATSEASSESHAMCVKLRSIVHVVLSKKMRLDEHELVSLIDPHGAKRCWFMLIPALVRMVEWHADLVASSPRLGEAVRVLAEDFGYLQNGKLQRRLEALVEPGASSTTAMPIEPGEPWSDAAIADIALCEPEVRAHWTALLVHCAKAAASSPSGKWSKRAGELVQRIGTSDVRAALLRWFPLVERRRTTAGVVGAHLTYVEGSLLILPHHLDVLKGLAWVAGSMSDLDLVRALGKLALTSYKKVPGSGPRAIKVGHAAVHALGQIPGRDSLAQIAMLQVKVKFIPAQKGIAKALGVAARRERLPLDEIEELAVPTYGLGEVGVLEEMLGELSVRLEVLGVGETKLTFTKKDGKRVKSVPAAIKTDHAEDLKELKAIAKDIGAMLPAQRDRIDAMYLGPKSWAMETWRERYLDHPLVGVLARRLIWMIVDAPEGAPGGAGTSVTWLDGKLVDAAGRERRFNADAAIVRLWHPLDETTDAVLAWRRFFEDRGLRQPFKQAHREIYLLTDAERRTSTYSNRYAAHVIRQHQFHALAAARGWENRLRLYVDQSFPPARRWLEHWGLRAEFWIEGVGDDVNDASTFLYLATDQVRFYTWDAAQVSAHAWGGGYEVARPRGTEPVADGAENPLPLERIPPLVLSEILRDVDLFVGVASVGNNPVWQDGGPDQRFREYWWTYGFGELSGTAQSRRELLARLLPRLTIAGVCELNDRFLTVRGRLREYSIHLGSGNILMKPDDRYLCIVPNASQASQGDVHLPFEGDRTLSIILSKAFMLASDDTIKDPSITQQIGRGR